MLLQLLDWIVELDWSPVLFGLLALFAGVIVGLSLNGYVWLGSWAWWRWMLSKTWADARIGIFRNNRASRGYPSFGPGGRWGIFILGLEIGSRDPGDPLGCWLVDHGLWRW